MIISMPMCSFKQIKLRQSFLCTCILISFSPPWTTIFMNNEIKKKQDGTCLTYALVDVELLPK